MIKNKQKMCKTCDKPFKCSEDELTWKTHCWDCYRKLRSISNKQVKIEQRADDKVRKRIAELLPTLQYPKVVAAIHETCSSVVPDAT